MFVAKLQKMKKYLMLLLTLLALLAGCKKNDKQDEPMEYDLSFERKTYYMLENSKLTLKPVLTPANDNVVYEWESRSTDVATVSDGVVRSKSMGSTRISCTAFLDGVEVAFARTNVEVTPERLIPGSEDEIKLVSGDAVPCGLELVSGKSIDFSEVTWTSSNETVAQAKEDRIYALSKAGTAVLTATYGELTCDVEVAVEALKITSSVSDIAEGETRQMTTNAASDNDVVWSLWSIVDDVATISPTGLLKGLNGGSVMVYAKRTNEFGTVTASANVKVKGVSISLSSSTVVVGESVEIVISNAEYSDVVLATTNASVARIDGKKVVGVSIGKADITATYNERIFTMHIVVYSDLFSVSATRKVRFSSGNLQYKASTGTWRFAENQYDYIGENNVNASSGYSGWIDLFGWGTSGYNGYAPYFKSDQESDYCRGSETPDSNLDWGVYNAISNGGDKAGVWRTLTESEWTYLLSMRSSSLRGLATVNGVAGLLILPDSWTVPSELTFTASTSSYTTNTYSLAAWSLLENSGAVFLPAAGWRGKTSARQIGLCGYYWAFSRYGDKQVYAVNFSTSGIDPAWLTSYSAGRSVRLVKNQ